MNDPHVFRGLCSNDDDDDDDTNKQVFSYTLMYIQSIMIKFIVLTHIAAYYNNS